MTAKKDLKRRIRDRQAATGESYMTARRHVLAAAPDHAPSVDTAAEPAAAPSPQPAAEPSPPAAATLPDEPANPSILYEEMVSLTAAGEALGFKCRLATTSSCARQIDGDALLRRFRDILIGTTDDPSMEIIRGIALRGEPRPAVARRNDVLERARRFLQRARVGIGGVTDDGLMLAFPLDTPAGSVMIIANVGWRPVPLPAHERPRLVFSVLSDSAVGNFGAQLLYIR